MKHFFLKLKKFNLKVALIRLLLLVGMLVLAFIPIYIILANTDFNLWNALVSGDQTKIIEAVSNYDNFYGAIIIAILQILQDWAIIIPSAPIHIAAGVILGTWPGFIVCHVADVVSNILVFALYKKIKNRMDTILPISDSNGTIKKIKNSRSSVYMVILVCLMPAIPNGFIPYAAVNADMNIRDYTLAVVIGAAPPKIVLTALGNSIFEGNWMLFVGLVIFACIGAYLLMKYQKETVNFFISVKNRFLSKKTDELVISTSEKEDLPADNNKVCSISKTDNISAE